jgi:hypothetical protein
MMIPSFSIGLISAAVDLVSFVFVWEARYEPPRCFWYRRFAGAWIATFRSMQARSGRSQSPTDFLASAHDPHHDLKRPPSGCSRLSPDRPEVMKLL